MYVCERARARVRVREGEREGGREGGREKARGSSAGMRVGECMRISPLPVTSRDILCERKGGGKRERVLKDLFILIACWKDLFILIACWQGGSRS